MPNSSSERAEDLASLAAAKSEREKYLRGRVAKLRNDHSATERAAMVGLSVSTVKRWDREASK